jgi:hypothetical protein
MCLATESVRDIVESESDFAGGIYLDTQGLPQGKGQPFSLKRVRPLCFSVQRKETKRNWLLSAN